MQKVIAYVCFALSTVLFFVRTDVWTAGRSIAPDETVGFFVMASAVFITAYATMTLAAAQDDLIIVHIVVWMFVTGFGVYYSRSCSLPLGLVTVLCPAVIVGGLMSGLVSGLKK
jgi:hypothetical protein